MTILELRNRLTDIIDGNNAHGWEERNDSDVAVLIHVSKRIYEYRKVTFGCRSWIGLNGINVFELITEDKPIWRGG